MATEEGEVGCVCEYVPDYLRKQVQLLADATGAYESQIVVLALQAGLSVILSKMSLASLLSEIKSGEMKERKGKSKLTGKGI